MSIQLPPRKLPGDTSTAWDPAWSQRVYGGDARWKALKAKYWASRWTLFRRCLWCRSGKALQLNHLTYMTTKLRPGWTPLLLLVPLCPRCHKLETAWTRKVRRFVKVGEHAVVTFGVYLLTRCIIVGGLWYLLVLWPGIPAPWNVSWP